MAKPSWLGRERELAAERNLTYRGTASIKIEVLRFRQDDRHEKGPDKKNREHVKDLANLFKTGFDRMDVRNHVPAVIDQQSLDAAIQGSGCLADTMIGFARESYPRLDFPPGFQLECLHGHDRVQAAARLLPPEDKRWVVDLYLAGSEFLCLTSPHS